MSTLTTRIHPETEPKRMLRVTVVTLSVFKIEFSLKLLSVFIYLHNLLHFDTTL